MSKHTHLFCRNNFYYYRIKVPQDLKHHISTREIKKSLRTTDHKVAITLAVSVEYEVYRAFALLRSNMLPDHLVPDVVHKLLGRDVTAEDVGVSLSQAIKQYIGLNVSKWSIKTKMENESSFQLLLEVISDMPLQMVTRQTVLDCRDTLCQLPGNMNKIYNGLSVKEILELKDVIPMSVTTVNKHLTRLSSLLKNFVRDGHLMCNYAEGMQIQQAKKVSEERKIYTHDDIKLIVTNLPIEKDKPERYWIPLIGLYAGMRLDEICQLYTDDIEKIDGLWCFNINNEDDKKVKNLSSIRAVPIHSNLLNLGLLEYVEKLKTNKCPRMWMNLKKRDADGYGSAFGKWFQRYNRQYVTDDPKKVFHSFRHTVADTLKQAGVQEVVIAEIMGHANDSMTTGRYGKRYQPKVLLDALMHLDYGIELPVWDM